MRFLKTATLSIVLLPLCLSLTACESMNTAMTDVKTRIAQIDLQNMKLPDFSQIEPSENISINSEEYDTGVNVAQNTPKNKTIDNANLATSMIPQTMNTDDTVRFAKGSATCPNIKIVDDLDVMHQFSSPKNPVERNRISSLYLTSLSGDCNVSGNNVVVDVNIEYEGILGPKARIWETDKPSFAYPYFMAMTDPSGNIITKDVYAVTMTYESGSSRVALKESLNQIIPKNNVRDLSDHTIMIGLQLTPDELAFNRTDTGLAYADISALGSISNDNTSYKPTHAAIKAPAPSQKPAFASVTNAIEKTSRAVATGLKNTSVTAVETVQSVSTKAVNAVKPKTVNVEARKNVESANRISVEEITDMSRATSPSLMQNIDDSRPTSVLSTTKALDPFAPINKSVTSQTREAIPQIDVTRPPVQGALIKPIMRDAPVESLIEPAAGSITEQTATGNAATNRDAIQIIDITEGN